MGNNKKPRTFIPGSTGHVLLSLIAEIPSTAYELEVVSGIKRTLVNSVIEKLKKSGRIAGRPYEAGSERGGMCLYHVTDSGRRMLAEVTAQHGDGRKRKATEVRKATKQPCVTCQAKYSQDGAGVFLLHS